MTKRKRLERREFVAPATGAAAAVAFGPTIRIRRRQKTLKILQWSHFVPSYDVWFDKYAKDWGTAKGIDVTVDHISLADLGTRANAEVAAQQGHDLFQFLSPPGAFEPQVLDMADVVKEAERQHGPLVDLCKRSTYNPVTRKWFGFSDNYVPDPGDYLKTVWTEIGLPDAGMNPAVLSWNAASNNQALNARQTSYILNSISAYRTAQDNKLPVADDIFFVPALKGPRGTRWASEHVMGIYAIWKFAQSPDVAKQFLLDLVAHYRDAVSASKLYISPSFPSSVTAPGTALGENPAAGPLSP